MTDHDQRLKAVLKNPWRTFLLGDLVQTYLPLEGNQQEEFAEYLTREEYMGVREYGTTWYEEGQIQGQRKLLTRMLENRFGPLSEAARDRLEALPPDRLESLGVELLSADSLKELGLED